MKKFVVVAVMYLTVELVCTSQVARERQFFYHKLRETTLFNLESFDQ